MNGVGGFNASRSAVLKLRDGKVRRNFTARNG
jgi:hypothetical protein